MGSNSTGPNIPQAKKVKEPTLLFEKSRGRRPRWCGQPLRVVGLGRDATLHGTYESRSCKKTVLIFFLPYCRDIMT